MLLHHGLGLESQVTIAAGVLFWPRMDLLMLGEFGQHPEEFQTLAPWELALEQVILSAVVRAVYRVHCELVYLRDNSFELTSHLELFHCLLALHFLNRPK